MLRDPMFRVVLAFGAITFIVLAINLSRGWG